MPEMKLFLAVLLSISGLSYAQEFDPSFSSEKMDSISVPVPDKAASAQSAKDKAPPPRR